MSESEVYEDDEISLFDLFEKLREGWRWLLGGLLLGGLGAATLIAISQPRYEATALLQTGKVSGAIVEDVPTMVERLKSASFHLEVAKAVADTGWIEQINSGSGNQVLSAVIPKSAPSMVEIRVKARSPDFAIRIADAATDLLIARQAELSNQILKKIGFDLAVVKERLANTERDLAMLTKTLTATNVRDERFSQMSLLTSLKLQKEAEVFSLRQSVFTLEASLLPPATQPARVLEAIFVSPRAISPKKGLLLALGVVGGLLAGVVLVFVSAAFRQARERRLETGVPVR